MFDSVDSVVAGLREQGYLAGRDLATQVYLASRLGKPLLVEGPSGSGRSSLAGVLAASSALPLLVVQCHASITPDEATHHWDTARQLLYVRQAEAKGADAERARGDAFTLEFFVPGPVVESFRAPRGAILLFRDVDLAPGPFQQWLATLLNQMSIEVPHLGRVSPAVKPLCLLTATSAERLSPGLLHGTLAVSLSYPPFEAEVEILLRNVAGLRRPLAAQIANFVGRLRVHPLFVRPGLAESLDWARALAALSVTALSPAILDQTAGCILKDARDIDRMRGAGLTALLGGAMDRSG